MLYYLIEWYTRVGYKILVTEKDEAESSVKLMTNKKNRNQYSN
jgi:hypothetical protein